MDRRGYRLGKRQHSVDRTRDAILEAARRLAAAGPVSAVSLGAVAREAGVSRITIYNHFGSKARLIEALPRHPLEGAEPAESGDPTEQLHARLRRACTAWSSDPALFRNIQALDRARESEFDRRLAERLAALDALRPGCSIKEAADVIAALTSFPVFDRLHQDGRRPAGQVAEILGRLASGILAQNPGVR